MKVDAALVWLDQYATTSDCHPPEPGVAYLELYPEETGDGVRFHLCYECAERFASLESRVAPDEATGCCEGCDAEVPVDDLGTGGGEIGGCSDAAFCARCRGDEVSGEGEVTP